MKHDKQCCAQEWESTNCNHACAAKAQHDARLEHVREAVAHHRVAADGHEEDAGQHEAGRDVEMRPESLPVPDVPLPREFADELTCVASWLHRHADRIRLESAEGELSSPLPRLDEFQPAGATVSRRTPRRERRGSPQPTR